MKKITSVLLLLFIATFSFAQKDSTYCGKWKITVDAGDKHTSSTYMMLNTDSTFSTNTDSTFTDQKQKASEGKWKLTPEGDIKLIPTDTSRESHFYKHVNGWQFRYYANEKNGIKSPAKLVEIEVFIEKVSINTTVQKKKKKSK